MVAGTRSAVTQYILFICKSVLYDRILSNIITCNISALNSKSKFHLRGLPYSLRVNCHNHDRDDRKAFLPSSAHENFLVGSKVPLIIEIYGCFFTSISAEGVFGKPLNLLRLLEKC